MINVIKIYNKLANTTIAIILQYLNVPNQFVVHLKRIHVIC